MSVSREELYRLIDALPAARRFLEYLRDVGNEEGDTRGAAVVAGRRRRIPRAAVLRHVAQGMRGDIGA